MPTPVPSFGIGDVLVVILYLIGVTAVGMWMSRGQTSKRDYFLGGRELNWWVVALAIIATETSALTFIGVPVYALGEVKYDNGVFSAVPGNMLFIQLVIGYLIGRIIIAWKIVPLYYKGDVYTPYQLLKRAFGNPARYVASALQLVGLALGQSVRVYIVAIPLTILVQTRFPDWNLALSIIAIMLFAFVYTTFGGIKAVVWTDLIQYFLFVGGGLFALFYIPTLISGDIATETGKQGWAAVFELTEKNREWFNLGWSASATLKDNLYSMFFGSNNIIMGLVPITIGIIFAFGFDQLNVQRILTCKNPNHGKAAMITSGVLIIPQFLLFLMIGVVLFAWYQVTDWNLGMDPWDPSKAASVGKPDSNFIFPIFIITQCPPIIKGFMIAAILAAAMSSVSAALSAMSSMVMMDFYKPMAGANVSEKSELKVSRVITIVCGVVLTLLAFSFTGSQNIVDLAFTIAGLTAGGILGAFIYAMIHKGGHWVPVVSGMIASFIGMTILNLIWKSSLTTMFVTLFGKFGIEYEPILKKGVAWPWHSTIGMLICLFVIYALRPIFASTGGDIESTQADDVN